MKIRYIISDLLAIVGLFAILFGGLWLTYGYGEFGIHVDNYGGYHIYVEDGG